MKKNTTTVTERGQISVPAEIRKRLKLVPGTRLRWVALGTEECKIVIDREEAGPGAKSMLGYAREFRKSRLTSQWMKELREGEGD
jgi:AbrB family looped-hinge helix DNA binding protein